MGKGTYENYRELRRAGNYNDAKLHEMENIKFTEYLSRLIETKQVSVLSIVENTSLSKSYINKLRNPSEKTVKPGRNVIIEIALAINATLKETNKLLKLARYQELYARDKAESVIIWGMLKHLPGKEIMKMLQDKGLDDIFNKKGKQD